MRCGAAKVLQGSPAGGDPHLPPAEEFIAACSRGDGTAARRICATQPEVISTLSESQRRLMPELAAQGCGDAVRLMVQLGWPIATPGGDWDASALNQAVFRGDAPLARFLLEHGASWTEQHGYGDNVPGTLSWASVNEPVDGGAWLGCTEALVAHGMPAAHPAPEGTGRVLIDGHPLWFPDEIAEFLLAASTPRGTTSR